MKYTIWILKTACGTYSSKANAEAVAKQISKDLNGEFPVTVKKAKA